MTHQLPHHQVSSPTTSAAGSGGGGGGGGSSPFDDGSMMMQMGLQFGTRIIDEGKGRLMTIETSELRKRFAVTHEYVVAKLRLLAFPFRHPRFAGLGLGGDSGAALAARPFGGDEGGGDGGSDGGGGGGGGASSLSPASGDAAAADLYVPLMAVITYVVVTAFGRGLTAAQLSPGELATTVTACGLVLVAETVAVRLWRMLTALPPPVMLDGLAHFGYLFVSVCYALLARAALEAWAPALSWACSAYFLGAFAFFLYKSVGDTFVKDGVVPKRALPIVYAATLVQAPLFLWFVRRAY